MIATEDLETLTETTAELADPEHAAELAEAEQGIAAGRTLSLEEVRRQIDGRR